MSICPPHRHVHSPFINGMEGLACVAAEKVHSATKGRGCLRWSTPKSVNPPHDVVTGSPPRSEVTGSQVFTGVVARPWPRISWPGSGNGQVGCAPVFFSGTRT